MKKITFPLILLVLTACGENKEVQPAEGATTVAVAENVTDSIQVDAITSATSKPNQVSFNGLHTHFSNHFPARCSARHGKVPECIPVLYPGLRVPVTGEYSES